MPAAFLVGAKWGLLGMALACLIGFPLVFAANLNRMLPLVGLRVADVLAVIGPSALADSQQVVLGRGII